MGVEAERIGLMCGTFDPPHLGHLLLAEMLRFGLELERVLFLPVGEPPHKPEGVTAVAHRLAMTRLAISDHPAFLLNTTDVERPAPHYTYTLIPELQQQYPRARFWLLLGSDSLLDLPTWQAPLTLLQHCRLGVLDRPGFPINLAALEAKLPGVAAYIDWADGVGMRVSSTWLREQLAAGDPIRYVLPSAVAAYIRERKLYSNA